VWTAAFTTLHGIISLIGNFSGLVVIVWCSRSCGRFDGRAQAFSDPHGAGGGLTETPHKATAAR